MTEPFETDADDHYALGHAARRAGLPRSSNPHNKRAAESRALWDAGWVDADGEASDQAYEAKGQHGEATEPAGQASSGVRPPVEG